MRCIGKDNVRADAHPATHALHPDGRRQFVDDRTRLDRRCEIRISTIGTDQFDQLARLAAVRQRRTDFTEGQLSLTVAFDQLPTRRSAFERVKHLSVCSAHQIQAAQAERAQANDNQVVRERAREARQARQPLMANFSFSADESGLVHESGAEFAEYDAQKPRGGPGCGEQLKFNLYQDLQRDARSIHEVSWQHRKTLPELPIFLSSCQIDT